MLSIWFVLLLIGLTNASDFRRNCQEALERGRSIIENNVLLLVQEETNRINRRLNEVTKAISDSKILHPESLGLVKYMVHQDSGSATTPAPCPSPNRTMFTTPAPTLPSTAPQSTTAGSSTSTTQWMTTSTSASSPFSRTTQMSFTSPSVSTKTSTLSTSPVSGKTPTSSTSSVTARTPTSSTSSVSQKSPTSLTASASGETTTSSATSSDVETGQAEPSIQTVPLAQEKLSTTSESYGSTISRANSTLPCAHTECIKSQDSDESTKPFLIPTFYSTAPEYDPFHNWMTAIYKYMFKTEEICNQPPMTDLNSITEDQLYGFLATLAAVHPGPFCSLCDRFMSELRERVFFIHPLWGDDEKYVMQLLYAHIPSPKAFCSTIAPGCYENYRNAVRNITEAVICLECSACMSISNVIQHRLLLDKEMLKKVLRFLRSSLFHNTCAELCEIFQPLNLTLFPHGFTYDGCMNFLADGFHVVVDSATVILRPERICSLELKWCELNEAPNMLHCLRELCLESLQDTPQAHWLCSQIPDTPTLADQFLNVHHTKRYKSRKPYHDRYLGEETSLHDEL
ncbi:hypothetical protein Angca_001853 [Angiostrongylus cantonensis]|nr:hypothetical protein Angca_001853 [Angiostrongylus cantonensis]